MEKNSATIWPIFVSNDNSSDPSFWRVTFSLNLDTKNPLKKKEEAAAYKNPLQGPHDIFFRFRDYSLEACKANYNTQFETLQLI